MRSILLVPAVCAVLATVTGLTRQRGGTAAGGQGTIDGIVLSGTFDPFECHDEEIKDAIVLKPRPDCGACHARGTVYHDPQGIPRLILSVKYAGAEKPINVWNMTGKQEPEGIVFAKPKFRLVYREGEIKGSFEGTMKAAISLRPEQDDGRQPAPDDPAKP